MMPPHCKLCRKNHRRNPDEDFKLLRFSLTAEEAARKEEEDAARKEGRYKVGHPIAVHWFCSAHAKQASPFTKLTWPEAKLELERTQLWWKRLLKWRRRG